MVVLVVVVVVAVGVGVVVVVIVVRNLHATTLELAQKNSRGTCAKRKRAELACS